jgi:hypothetical protein
MQLKENQKCLCFANVGFYRCFQLILLVHFVGLLE